MAANPSLKPCYLLTLPQSLLPGLNETLDKALANKYSYGRIKKKVCHDIGWEVKAQLPGIYLRARSSLIIHWYVPDRRKDPDNVYAAGKYILDGFRDGGLVQNDGHKWFADTLNQISVDPAYPRAEVLILVGRRLLVDFDSFPICNP